MKTLYNKLLDLGVHEEVPFLQQKRLRSSNFLLICAAIVYLAYFLLGLAANSLPLMITTVGMMLSVVAGLFLNGRRHYGAASTAFFSGFSLMLLFCCNSLNDGGDFAVFYLPAVMFCIIIYDFETDTRIAFFSISFMAVCIAGTFLLPAHSVTGGPMASGWSNFFHVFNYCMAFAAAFGYIFFTARYINKNSKALVKVWMEAERQMEAYLEQKNRAEAAAEAKSQFLANMSHELRTPLNGIIGTVHLLIQDELPKTQKQHFKVLKYSSEHMLSIVNDVLDFSKIEAGQMEISHAPFNFTEAMEKLQTVFEKQFADRNIALVFDIDKGLGRDFISDETRLNQVLTNLLSNALKFSKRGSVRLSARTISSTSQSAEIRFAVQDTGIGISPEQQQTIFEAFRQAEFSNTRSFGGTGLGLAISRSIVEKLGGSLEVDSQLGRGSIFHFTLSLEFSQRRPLFVNEQKAAALQSLRGARVLIADDNYVNRRITRSFLERWEVEMDEANDGKEALQLFGSKKYDLLLIDLHMPVMDGYETIAAIRKIDGHVSALAFTAAVLPDMRKKLTDCGFTDFLQKPFRPEDLHNKIVSSCALGLSA